MLLNELPLKDRVVIAKHDGRGIKHLGHQPRQIYKGFFWLVDGKICRWWNLAAVMKSAGTLQVEKYPRRYHQGLMENAEKKHTVCGLWDEKTPDRIKRLLFYGLADFSRSGGCDEKNKTTKIRNNAGRKRDNIRTGQIPHEPACV